MGPFLSEFVKVMRVVLQFIGGTTVIGFLGWLYKRRQENFEDSVLLMFEMDPHQQLRTVEGIHSDYIGRCLKDVPTWVVIAPPQRQHPLDSVQVATPHGSVSGAPCLAEILLYSRCEEGRENGAAPVETWVASSG